MMRKLNRCDLFFLLTLSLIAVSPGGIQQPSVLNNIQGRLVLSFATAKSVGTAVVSFNLLTDANSFLTSMTGRPAHIVNAFGYVRILALGLYFIRFTHSLMLIEKELCTVLCAWFAPESSA
jgi:hypothetical protein